jgi:hypothetical protein
LVSNFGDYPILAILAIRFAALCLHPSARPHPGVDVLLQTKAQPPFDRPVIGLSKPLFLVVSGSNLAEC